MIGTEGHARDMLAVCDRRARACSVLGEFLSSLDLSGLSICDRGARLMADLVLHTPRKWWRAL